MNVKNVFIFLVYLEIQTVEQTTLVVVNEIRIWIFTQLTIWEYTTLIIVKMFYWNFLETVNKFIQS
jgi:hypothetical protein